MVPEYISSFTEASRVIYINKTLTLGCTSKWYQINTDNIYLAYIALYTRCSLQYI